MSAPPYITYFYAYVNMIFLKIDFLFGLYHRYNQKTGTEFIGSTFGRTVLCASVFMLHHLETVGVDDDVI